MQTDKCAPEALSIEDVPMPFAVLSPEGRVLTCNRALLELAGLAGETPAKMPPQPGLIPREWKPDQAGSMHFPAELVARGRPPVKVEAFVRRIDDVGGAPCRFMVEALDEATVRSLGEKALISAEQKASLVAYLLDDIGAPVFATDEQSRIIYANGFARRLFGQPGYDVTGQGLWDVYPVSQTDLFYRIYHRALQERRTLSADHYAPGLNVWYEARFFPRKDGGMVVLMNNVTARKQYERFMGLAAYTVNRLSDYIFWLDSRGRVTRANDVAYKELNFPESQKALINISRVADMTQDAWARIWEEIKAKGTITLKSRLIRRNGDSIPVEASVSFVLYVGKEFGVVIAKDITDRIRAEQEITRSREQAELYLDLMSHDIRNMNQIGAGFLELAMSDPDIGEEAKAMLDKPLEAFNRSTELIANVKKLQKATGALVTEETDLLDVLRNVAAQYSEVKGRDVSIELRAGESCCVMANPLLKEAFANLVGNAIKHSKGRINVWITLRKSIIADRPCCEVIIEDDGPGIPDAVKKKLFSVKKLRESGGRYRGLGLILTRTLLDDFGGTIQVEDRIQGDYKRGTRFIVTLPAAT